MNYLSYEDILEDIKICEQMDKEQIMRNAEYSENRKQIDAEEISKKLPIKAITPNGCLIIRQHGTTCLTLTNDEGKEYASTYEVNMCGFNWIKREARGWHGWGFKLRWKQF